MSKRIGVAFAKPWEGPTQRRQQYGIYDNGTCKYEGYREVRADGEVIVGLPLAGPGADHLQPFIPFVESNYAEVRWFEGLLRTRFDRVLEDSDLDALVRRRTAMRDWLDLEKSLRDDHYVPTIILYGDESPEERDDKIALRTAIKARGYRVYEGSKSKKSG